jgi:hypothetical protein
MSPAADNEPVADNVIPFPTPLPPLPEPSPERWAAIWAAADLAALERGLPPELRVVPPEPAS